MGKIINIFYNDLHTIELKSIPFLNALIAPLAFSGIIALLLTRFGWSGILILGFIVLIVPIQTLIAKINSTFVKKNNVNKDSRTKLFI